MKVSFFRYFLISPFFVSVSLLAVGAFGFFVFHSNFSKKIEEASIKKYLYKWNSEIADTLEKKKDTTIVKKLAEGLYGLSVDGFVLKSNAKKEPILSSGNFKCSKPKSVGFYSKQMFNVGKIEYCISDKKIIASMIPSMPVFLYLISLIFIVALSAHLPINSYRKHLNSVLEYFDSVTRSNNKKSMFRTRDKTVGSMVNLIARQIEQKIESNKMLVELDSQKRHSDTIRQAAHDLKNPVTSLQRILDLDPEISKEELKPTLNKILGICKEMRKDYQSSSYKLKKASFNKPGPFIRDCVESRKVLNSKINFTLDLESDAHAIFVESEFQRVITNLIDNASDGVSRVKKPKIIVSSKYGDDVLEIKITDNGKGIPEEILNKVFDQGFTYGKASGTGLGLYYVQKKLSEWGGKVEITSSKKGTTAKLLFISKTFNKKNRGKNEEDKNVTYLSEHIRSAHT